MRHRARDKRALQNTPIAEGVRQPVQGGRDITANLFAIGWRECTESSVRNAVLRDGESSTFAQSRALGRGSFFHE